ncbi:MAG: hypothetical protein OXU61_04200 [Gammaproteobacteria bacterium]|nr:hypothetical protein [Gammaproteobacteria bacterium]
MDMRLVGEFHGIRGRRAVSTAKGKKWQWFSGTARLADEDFSRRRY